jgi:hypothetical protein
MEGDCECRQQDEQIQRMTRSTADAMLAEMVYSNVLYSGSREAHIDRWSRKDGCTVRLAGLGRLGQYFSHFSGQPVWNERFGNVRYPRVEHAPSSDDLRRVPRCEEHLQLWP